MSEDRELIVGGELQSRTGLETTADAGVCALSGTWLYRNCITPRVARIERMEKGCYQIIRSDGRSSCFDEIEANNRREALLKWYESRLDNVEAERDEAHQAYCDAIETAAIRLFRQAMANGGVADLGSYYGSGGRHALVEDGDVRTNDLFRFAEMMGMVCHIRNSRVFFGETESVIGKKMHDSERKYLSEAIAFAPPDPGPQAPNLRGWWVGRGWYLCAHCAGRILARGCPLPEPVKPVWRHRPEPYGKCLFADACGNV